MSFAVRCAPLKMKSITRWRVHHDDGEETSVEKMTDKLGHSVILAGDFRLSNDVN